MPIVRVGPQLVYFAHVPKCGGTSVEAFLEARFGPVAMLDARHHYTPPELRWSRTSPQHIAREVREQLFPAGFFDLSFAVVRHPVARLVSAYHFQHEIERQPSAQNGFSAWLEVLPQMMADNPFVFDNHTRPMVDMVPDDAKIFHLEHGLDALVPWFDELTGDTAGPRALRASNERHRRKRQTGTKVTPSAEDLAVISKIYAADFDRFGYTPEAKAPLAPAPELSPEFLVERDAELARGPGLGAWLRKRIDRAMR